MAYMVQWVQGADWADGADRADWTNETDVADVAYVALCMNALFLFYSILFYFDCLGHKSSKI